MVRAEVLIQVPGDREAVKKYLDENKIPYIDHKGALFIINTGIVLGNYGDYGSRLSLNKTSSSEVRDKVNREGMPEAEQVKLFNQLKKEIMNSRKKYYAETEKKQKAEEEQRKAQIEEIRKLIDFENLAVKQEHNLEGQIKKTINFLQEIQKDFPKASYQQTSVNSETKTDCHNIELQLSILMEILSYLKNNEIEAVNILKDINNPVMIEKNKQKIAIQKDHLMQLTKLLSNFANGIKYFYRTEIKKLQITPKMRNNLKNLYEPLSGTFEWYANLFKKIAKA